MKTNPYRLVERCLIALLGVAATGFLIYIITITHMWKALGIIVGLLVGVFLLVFLREEWGSRKHLWDLAHGDRYQPADSDKINIE